MNSMENIVLSPRIVIMQMKKSESNSNCFISNLSKPTSVCFNIISTRIRFLKVCKWWGWRKFSHIMEGISEFGIQIDDDACDCRRTCGRCELLMCRCRWFPRHTGHLLHIWITITHRWATLWHRRCSAIVRCIYCRRLNGENFEKNSSSIIRQKK